MSLNNEKDSLKGVTSTSLPIQGVFEVEIIRKDGTVEKFSSKNVVTREAKAYLLRAGISGETATSSTWYVGLIGNNITPTETDTAATALGTSGTYGEVTSYSETTRPSYQSTYKTSINGIDNTDNPASFTINSNVSVYGLFITNTAAKNSNSGILLCASRFQTAKNFSNGDTVVVRYSILTTT